MYFIQNIKYLCLTSWLGGLSTNNDDHNNTEHQTDKARFYKAHWLTNQMNQKVHFSKVSFRPLIILLRTKQKFQMHGQFCPDYENL